jgi:exodeoxyribonuclease VII small subunit
MNNNLSPEIQLTFEAAFQRLEEIAGRLETGNTPLEQAFALYEEGQKLLQLCHGMLDQAEKRLKLIQTSGDAYSVKEERIE